MMFMSLSNITISSIDSVDYYCIINRISKSEAVNLPKNADLNERNGTL